MKKTIVISALLGALTGLTVYGDHPHHGYYRGPDYYEEPHPFGIMPNVFPHNSPATGDIADVITGGPARRAAEEREEVIRADEDARIHEREADRQRYKKID